MTKERWKPRSSWRVGTPMRRAMVATAIGLAICCCIRKNRGAHPFVVDREIFIQQEQLRMLRWPQLVDEQMRQDFAGAAHTAVALEQITHQIDGRDASRAGDAVSVDDENLVADALDEGKIFP